MMDHKAYFKDGRSSIIAWADVLMMIGACGWNPNDMEWHFTEPEHEPILEGNYGSIAASHEPGRRVEEGHRLSDVHRAVAAYEASRGTQADLMLVPHHFKGVDGKVTRGWLQV